MVSRGHDAFARAIADCGYGGKYSCVYPIKVNQQRHVVEEVLKYGKAFNFGLEAGSKPELLAVVALTEAETPIICNGFKDAEFIEMAMLAQKKDQPGKPQHHAPPPEEDDDLDEDAINADVDESEDEDEAVDAKA